jgi:putative inorganic carbon (HCO3(-)) transporter
VAYQAFEEDIARLRSMRLPDCCERPRHVRRSWLVPTVPLTGEVVAAAPREGAVAKVVTLLVVLAAVGLAALSGLGAATGSKLAVILPVAVAVGMAFGLLALTRFSLYVMAMLVLRASIDLAKLSKVPSAGLAGGAAVAPRGLDPSSLLGIVFLLAAALWLAAQHRQRGSLPGSTLRRALLVFVAAALLSVPASANLQASAVDLLRVLAAVAMFIVLEQLITSRAVLRRVLLAVYLSALFPLGYTIFGFLAGHPPSEVKNSLTRITGTFGQSNAFGRYLMLLIIFGVALYPHLGRRLRLALGGILALSSVFLLLTYTRTALVGAVIGLLVVGLLQSKRVLLGLVVLGIAALLLVPQLSTRFSGLSATTTGSGNTLVWRLGYWTQVLPLANSNPVTGTGLNTTPYLTEQGKQPHNDFVRAYVETGLIGLGAYIAMLIALVALGIRAIRASPPRSFDRGVAVGYLGCAVAFVAVSVASNTLSDVVILWYLFAFAAAAAAILQHPSPERDRLVDTGGNPRGNY